MGWWINGNARTDGVDMALTYQESAELMSDQIFRDRIKVACLHYADYISAEPANTPAHNTRYRWAQQTMINPDNTVVTVTPAVVMQEAVQEQGSAISDTDLQVAVETAINKIM
ncbi:MAG TPA: hypothetical protein VGE97_08735 [Nitrososphaera sp.]|jgi:hypothetical protein